MTTPPLNETRSIENVEHLERMLSEPAERVVEMMRHLEGDIILLGAAGKIGPSLARMARRATDLAGVSRRVIGVSRFSSSREQAALDAAGIETIRCDLAEEAAVAELPDVRNVIYLAGKKFGSSSDTPLTWAMNTWMPGVICRKFRSSRIVAYSTGNVYGATSVAGGGARETDPVQPVGEYAMSCLGRERIMEYFCHKLHIPMALIRLFYACEVRYGVLVDLARKVASGASIDLSVGYFNVIWQGDNNAQTLLALEHVSTPPLVLNLTGPEIMSVREAAQIMGCRLGRKPVFTGTELDTSFIGNAQQARSLLGPPRVNAMQLLDWVVDWVERGGEYLDKPTHFETRDGNY